MLDVNVRKVSLYKKNKTLQNIRVNPLIIELNNSILVYVFYSKFKSINCKAKFKSSAHWLNLEKLTLFPHDWFDSHYKTVFLFINFLK